VTTRGVVGATVAALIVGGPATCSRTISRHRYRPTDRAVPVRLSRTSDSWRDLTQGPALERRAAGRHRYASPVRCGNRRSGRQLVEECR
jgi:hypothetical protein